jgi:adenylate cyclase
LLKRLFQKLPFLWRLIVINVGSNLIGFFLVQVLLRYAQPVQDWGRFHDLEKQTNFFLLSFLIPAAILFLWWVSRPVAPIFDSLTNGREVDRDRLVIARRRVINLPFWVAGMNLVAWIIPAVTFPAILRMQLDLSAVTTGVFILYNFINALMITLWAFVTLEYSCRKHIIPQMFPDGHIREQKGAITLSIRHRLMIMYMAICLLPMFQITLMTKTYSSFSKNPETIGNLLDDLGDFSLIIFGFTAIYGLWLAVLFAKNLAEPAGEIMAVTEEIRNGHFNGRVKVVSNDEIGYLGDRVNEMAKGLKEREEIKEAFNLLTSPEIGAEILSGRVHRGGETRIVTLLFSDLRGFTGLAERLPPEMTLEAINSYFTEMTEAIISNNGVVLQYVGDEIEAVFGAPQNDPQHAEHAVSAAIAMRERLARLNEIRSRAGKEPLRHGVGVHTGPALAGIVGSAYKISYAMVGDTVNIASRVQDLTKKLNADILISSQTRELLKHSPRLSDPVKMSLKGKTSSIQVCRVL